MFFAGLSILDNYRFACSVVFPFCLSVLPVVFSISFPGMDQLLFNARRWEIGRSKLLKRKEWNTTSLCVCVCVCVCVSVLLRPEHLAAA